MLNPVAGPDIHMLLRLVIVEGSAIDLLVDIRSLLAHLTSSPPASRLIHVL
jgi:hypothetical protein